MALAYGLWFAQKLEDETFGEETDDTLEDWTFFA